MGGLSSGVASSRNLTEVPMQRVFRFKGTASADTDPGAKRRSVFGGRESRVVCRAVGSKIGEIKEGE